MKEFTESMRYDYPLTPDSVVWDVGGYEGNFAAQIYLKYRCRVRVFEPVFTGKVINTLGHYPIEVSPVGLGGRQRTEKMRIKGDSTGLFADSGEEIDVVIVDASALLDADHIALLKLNCEGAEYEILERLLETGDAQRIRDIQVQFHTCAPHWQERYDAIAAGLGVTHELTYRAPFCWENWRLKS